MIRGIYELQMLLTGWLDKAIPPDPAVARAVAAQAAADQLADEEAAVDAWEPDNPLGEYPPIVPAGGVERRPPFHGSSAAGGHPVRSTSELLTEAAWVIDFWAIKDRAPRLPEPGFTDALLDRAAQMRAHGD